MESQQFDERAAQQSDDLKKSETHVRSDRLGTLGWALFLIWIGIAFLANLHIGIGLLGIGVITLGVQIARVSTGLKLEVFWLIVGLIFLVGGLWELLEPDLPLVPIVIIVAGLVLLISSFRRKSG